MLELLAIAVLVCLGRWIGGRAGRSRHWWAGWVIPMVVMVAVALGRRVVFLWFVPPFSWVASADVNPLLMAIAVPILLTTLITRLAQPRQRWVVTVLMWFMVGYYALLPVVSPWLARPILAASPTVVDGRGVCRQTHDYTCGPASAVTVLHALGIDASEGDLAIRARCGPAVGTDGYVLARAINQMHANKGVMCTYRHVQLDELRTPAIAQLYSNWEGGHYVAVLEVGRDSVVLGDPLTGRVRESREEFLQEWSGGAIVFERTKGLATMGR